jgi:nucleotide-binding universal stress UspA family protein
MPRHEVDEYVEAARLSEQQALADVTRAFADRFGDTAVELVKGEPEDVIQHYVEERGIDLVVMGTVARTGITGVLIGNTAERMIQRLRVSVLATKPAGFTSPVDA